jgi:polysaccharide export outer membrane protein
LQAQLKASQDIMAQRHDSESEGLHADADEFAKIEDFYKRGLAPNTRMADARRLLLLSSIQSLQSAVELERAKTDLEKGTREIDKFDDARKIKLLSELRDSNASLETLRSDIKVAREKLTYVGMRKSLGRQGSTETNIQIVRDAKTIASDLDVELKPGDVVEVTLSLGVPKDAGQ